MSYCTVLTDLVSHFRYFRSWDGMTLYAASSDGTIAVFDFEQDELEGIAPHSVQEQYLSKFGFAPPPLPEGYSHVIASSHNASVSEVRSQSAAFDTATIGGEVVNVLVAKRNNKKKRAGLTTMSSVPSAGAGPSSYSNKRASFLPDSDAKLGKPGSPLVRESSFPAPDEQPFNTHPDWHSHGDVNMAPSDAFDSGSMRKKDEVSRPMYKTLGGNRQREMVLVKEINDYVSVGGSLGLSLPVPATLTRITAELDGTHIFEGLNPEDGGEYSTRADIHCSKHFQVLPRCISSRASKHFGWIICRHRSSQYMPRHIFVLPPCRMVLSTCIRPQEEGISRFDMYDRVRDSVAFLRLMPTLNLGLPCSILDGSKNCLLVITQAGVLHLWYELLTYSPDLELTIGFLQECLEGYRLLSSCVRCTSNIITKRHHCLCPRATKWHPNCQLLKWNCLLL